VVTKYVVYFALKLPAIAEKTTKKIFCFLLYPVFTTSTCVILGDLHCSICFTAKHSRKALARVIWESEQVQLRLDTYTLL